MVEAIKQHLQTKWLGRNIIFEECMDSTNIRTKELGEKNVINGTVVVARRQTAGRGRRGRNWFSPEGNCYFSVLLRPDIQAVNASQITLVVAMALVKTIEKISGLNPQIKWPNDIVLDGKKLCGILTESSVGEDGLKYVVVGVGVNANQTDFDDEIKSMATSLVMQNGQAVDCSQLIGTFLNCFEVLLEKFLKTQDMSVLMEDYNKLLVNRDKEVRLLGERESVGVAIGINEKGELLVQMEDKTIQSVVSGEVSVRGLYGYV